MSEDHVPESAPTPEPVKTTRISAFFKTRVGRQIVIAMWAGFFMIAGGMAGMSVAHKSDLTRRLERIETKMNESEAVSGSIKSTVDAVNATINPPPKKGWLW